MKITTRQGPSFGVARIVLDPNENVRVEAGAMMAMSAGVLLQAKAEGGFMKSFKRAALGGESFFLTTYTAPEAGGFVDVAAKLPGDLVEIAIGPGKSWVLSKGSWLASPGTVTLDTSWGGFKNMFGAEGGFVVRASGEGPVVLGCYGALDKWELAAGQTVTVDTGHMVAYEDTVQMALRKVTGGFVQTFKSGEGLVFDFTGPGTVYTQTRNPMELVGWIRSFIPSQGGSSAGVGVLGGLAGGLFDRD